MHRETILPSVRKLRKKNFSRLRLIVEFLQLRCGAGCRRDEQMTTISMKTMILVGVILDATVRVSKYFMIY